MKGLIFSRSSSYSCSSFSNYTGGIYIYVNNTIVCRENTEGRQKKSLLLPLLERVKKNCQMFRIPRWKTIGESKGYEGVSVASYSHIVRTTTVEHGKSEIENRKFPSWVPPARPWETIEPGAWKFQYSIPLLLYSRRSCSFPPKSSLFFFFLPFLSMIFPLRHIRHTYKATHTHSPKWHHYIYSSLATHTHKHICRE